jgi:hypothetical protein
MEIERQPVQHEQVKFFKSSDEVNGRSESQQADIPFK